MAELPLTPFQDESGNKPDANRDADGFEGVSLDIINNVVVGLADLGFGGVDPLGGGLPGVGGTVGGITLASPARSTTASLAAAAFCLMAALSVPTDASISVMIWVLVKVVRSGSGTRGITAGFDQ